MQNTSHIPGKFNPDTGRTHYLYHADYNLPQFLRKDWVFSKLTYSAHAQREMLKESGRSGIIRPENCPQSFDSKAYGVELIEVEISEKNGSFKVEKSLYRMPLPRDERDQDGRTMPPRDLVLAITSEGVVKTVWANLQSDDHRTLDKSKYVSDVDHRLLGELFKVKREQFKAQELAEPVKPAPVVVVKRKLISSHETQRA